MNYIKDKDLNLLRIFLLFLEERSVSRVASKLRLTQPALSRSLSRLREEFKDPLFVRTAGGMLPTPKALSLEPILRKALESVALVYATQKAFDPTIAKGVVKIATTDYFEQVLWVHLLTVLRKKAPGIVWVTKTTGSVLPASQMRDGDVQLAIAGYFVDIPNGFMRQAIYKDEFACVVRTNHPDVKRQLDLKTFLKLDHLIVSPEGHLEGAVDRALMKTDHSRRVAASVTNFLSAGPIIAHTDMVLTTPSQIAAKFRSYLPVRTLAPPVLLPSIQMVQVWHERYHNDPLIKWVRDEILDACKTFTPRLEGA